MNVSKLEFKIRVEGTHPKDFQLVVNCGKGDLYFDYESRKLVFPNNFKEHCKRVGAIWAIRFEDEIKISIEKYLTS